MGNTITDSLGKFYDSIAAGIGDWGLKLIGAQH
jgi:small conductance mechanosensitive channel